MDVDKIKYPRHQGIGIFKEERISNRKLYVMSVMFYKGNVNTLFQLLSISENFEVNIKRIFLGHNEGNLKLLIE